MLLINELVHIFVFRIRKPDTQLFNIHKLDMY